MIGPRRIVAFALLLLNAIFETIAMEFPDCDISQLSSCKSSMMFCDQETKKCKCTDDYVYNPECKTYEDMCIKPSDDANDAHGSNPVVTMLIVLFFLALIFSGLVLTFRRYNLVHWFRQRISNRRDNNAMYEDVMIGQDDPPIAA